MDTNSLYADGATLPSTLSDYMKDFAIVHESFVSSPLAYRVLQYFALWRLITVKTGAACSRHKLVYDALMHVVMCVSMFI